MVAAQGRSEAARLTPPLDQHTIGSDHVSGSFSDQSGAIMPAPTDAGFF